MIQQTGSKVDSHSIGSQIYDLVERLFSLHRSQTGEGNRQSFKIISDLIPLQVSETPSGSAAFDWTIPKEWKIEDAYIAFRGERIVDYRESNLHVLNGSQHFSGQLNFDGLAPHLFRHEKSPDAIPYRTAFFRDQWGFCVTQSQFELLEQLGGPFDVHLNSLEIDGSLSYAEFDTQPDAEKSILIWAHCCHPSLANDNLSGMAVAAILANQLAEVQTRFNYRIVFAPATIGAINWLARADLDSFVDGIVLTLLGDANEFHYKQTPKSDSTFDRVFQLLARANQSSVNLLDFEPFGYDERQFCSPSSPLHVGRLSRSLPDEFPEYHSSLDNLALVSEARLEQSFDLLFQAIQIVEANAIWVNRKGHCEPFLQPFNLFRSYGDKSEFAVKPEAVMYALNLADGKNDSIEIANRSGLAFGDIQAAIKALKEVGILELIDHANEGKE